VEKIFVNGHIKKRKQKSASPSSVAVRTSPVGGEVSSDNKEEDSTGLEPTSSTSIAVVSTPMIHAALPRSEQEAQHVAATRIQALYRCWRDRGKVLVAVRQAHTRIFDPDSGLYFFYSTKTGESSWNAPAILRGAQFEPREVWAACLLQKTWRANLARRAFRQVLENTYERTFDLKSSSWLYRDVRSGSLTWEKPKLFGSMEPPVSACDVAVFAKEAEVTRLQEELRQTKQELANVQEQVTAALVVAGQLDGDEVKGRSKHMDEWSASQVADWLSELGYPQHAEGALRHRVDGLLLLHMMGEDWGHMGVSSPLHVRRIGIEMQKYHMRYEIKRQAKEAGQDTPTGSDDGLSDYSHSEDDMDQHSEADGPNSSSGIGHAHENEEHQTVEELEQARLDKENMQKETIFAGDGLEHPEWGDVVKIHYTCTTVDGRMIENSRKMRKWPLEFVLGDGSVIMGMERGILTMTFGERAKFTFQSAYAYGHAGFPPAIRPDSALVLDVNLIKFWRRPRWIKPLIQVAGTYSEAPYSRKPAQPAESAPALGETATTTIASEISASSSSHKSAEMNIVPYGTVL
jgi:FKBP-type peptidyl-prolyl cis-trans isomerase